MERFSIDESGYTGFDLFNEEQRYQGATAVNISDADASHLIKEHFPKLQAPELKFSALTRRPNNQERLLNLQKDILENFNCITYICDKRYLLTLMLMDFAVEPFYYERGINFYEDGQNYALASLLYLTGPTFLGKSGFDSLLLDFQSATKEKSWDSINKLVTNVRSLNWKQLPEALGPLAQADADCIETIATPGVTTDAAIIVLQSLINRMEVTSLGPYRVEHDKSKNLLNYHSLLEQFIHHKDEVEFKQTQIAGIKFPLKLSEVTQVESKFSPAVQIADVMIGAALQAANESSGLRDKTGNAEKIFAMYKDEQFIHLVPSLNFEEQKKFREGTQAGDVIDYFAKNFKY